MYSGTLLTRSPTGYENLAVLRGRVELFDWSKLSEVLTVNHNCTSKQLFFNTQECRYYFKKIETSISTYNSNNGKMNITGLSGRVNGLKSERII